MRKTLILTDSQTAGLSQIQQLAAMLPHHQLTTDLDVLNDLGGHKLLVVAGALAQLSPPQEKSLCQWVTGGGGLMAFHAAAEICNDNARFLEMLGMQCVERGPVAEFNVNISDNQHEITRNFNEFRT